MSIPECSARVDTAAQRIGTEEDSITNYPDCCRQIYWASPTGCRLLWRCTVTSLASATATTNAAIVDRIEFASAGRSTDVAGARGGVGEILGWRGKGALS